MTRHAHYGLTAVALAVAVTLGAEQGPARDPGVVAGPASPSANVTTGTAAVTGIVTTDDRSPRPLRRARVTIARTAGGAAQAVVTDDEGRFAFVGLAAGNYTLQAAKGGYLRSNFGGGRVDRRPTPISLSVGQRLAGIALKLTRGAVISGTITDETGVPAVGVMVSVLQSRISPGGTRSLEPPADVGAAATDQTDDRGVYRIYALPAGEYAVVASARFAPAGGDVRAMTDADIRSALQTVASAARPPAAPTTSTAPRPDSPPGSKVTYAPVFFPGTTSSSNLAMVTVAAGDERTNVDFQLQLVRTSRVEGTLVAPPGVAPQSVQLIMTPANAEQVEFAGAFSPLARAQVAADGTFSYSGVAPGQYTISARTGGGPISMQSGSGDRMMVMVQPQVVVGRAADAGPGTAPSEQYWGTTSVTVQGQTVSNVVVAMQPAMTMTGHIAFDRTRLAPPSDLTRARVSLVGMASGPGLSMSGPTGSVDTAGAFKLTGVIPGRYRLEGSVPGDASGQWTLASVTVNSRDVLDLPLEITPGEEIANALLTFTDATQEVSGTLQDATGRPAPDYTILVFASDSRYWSTSARRVRSTRPGTDGKFSIVNLPAGSYRIAALADVAPGELNDPTFLASIADGSVPFTLASGEKKMQDFRIGQ